MLDLIVYVQSRVLTAYGFGAASAGAGSATARLARPREMTSEKRILAVNDGSRKGLL